MLYSLMVVCCCGVSIGLQVEQLNITSKFSLQALPTTYENGVLRKLKHIFPNTYQRIKSICSPAKGGTGCYRFNYQPGS